MGNGVYKYTPAERGGFKFCLAASPMRRRRPDQITAPEFVGDPMAEGIAHALRPLDKVATEMEERWGVDRLATLVTPDTASRFGTAKAKLDSAIKNNDAGEVAKRASVMIRGWQAMDAEATDAGATWSDPQAWVWVDDADVPHAFGKGTAEAARYLSGHPGVSVWTMAEIVRVAASFSEKQRSLIAAVKKEFPGASVRSAGPVPDDDIPF